MLAQDIDMNTDLRKKNNNNNLKNTFLSRWIMQFLEKLWKMWENLEIPNLSQEKEEGMI